MRARSTSPLETPIVPYIQKMEFLLFSRLVALPSNSPTFVHSQHAMSKNVDKRLLCIGTHFCATFGACSKLLPNFSYSTYFPKKTFCWLVIPHERLPI